MIHYLPFTLTLRAPLLVTALGGDPNSARTLPYIPGSVLRGAVARALGDPGGDAERLAEFRRLVLGGRVCYLNAYPVASLRRSLPMPLSFRIPKDRPHAADGSWQVIDLAAFSGCGQGDGGGEEWPAETLTAVPAPFVTLGAAQPELVRPALASRVHHQRDRAKGRAWKARQNGGEVSHGALFTYEFLEDGQTFQGLILVRGETEVECAGLMEGVKSCLAGPLLLGRSRRGSYGGKAAIAWGHPRDRELDGEGLVRGDIPQGSTFRLLLTSPYIGRNTLTGHLDPTYLEQELIRALGGRAQMLGRCWSFEAVGGFNRKWRLETPQAPALAAGSVLVLKATEAIPLEDLPQIEHTGFGERRVEGFGRVAFWEAPRQWFTLRNVARGTATSAPGGDAPEIVRFAEQRLLISAAEREIARVAARLASSASRLPSSSLLGRLRPALRGDPQTGLETLRAWLGHGGASRLRRPAMDQLERCRMDRASLADWLRGLAAQGGSRLESTLRLDVLAQRHHVVSEARAVEVLRDQSEVLKVRLIGAVLAALARRNRQRGSTS